MDLSRAKTILIMAFLSLNIFLIFQLWARSDLVLSHIHADRGSEQVHEQLAEKNYNLAVAVPRQGQKMSLLSVEAMVLDRQAFIEALLPADTGHLVSRKGNQDVEEELYISGNKELRFKGKGLVEFKNVAPEAVTQDKIDHEELANQLISSLGIDTQELELDYARVLDSGGKELRYYQVYEDKPIYASYIKLLYHNSQLVAMDFYWLGIRENSGEERLVIPANGALLSFVDARGPALTPTEITGITLGYYSQEYDAQSWDIFPVWRIFVEDKEIVYVNAYSGEIELKQGK